jgi:hypothetical protein
MTQLLKYRELIATYNEKDRSLRRLLAVTDRSMATIPKS